MLLLSLHQLHSQLLFTLLRLRQLILTLLFELLGAAVLLLHLTNHGGDVILQLLDAALVLGHAVPAALLTCTLRPGQTTL